jgi:predicted nucleic acid-binding protein
MAWSSSQASAAIYTVASALAPLLPEPDDLFAEWLRLCVNHNVVGPACYDARLVALMNRNGISRILTLNKRDFTRFPQIAAIDPSTI